MPFPSEERLKNLIESNAGSQLPRFDNHPHNDNTLVGVITAITASGTNYFLQVVPLQPQTVPQDGTVVIDNGSHPLAAVPNPASYERVVPLNIPLNLVPLYFYVGQRIEYFQYSAGQGMADEVRGTYGTWVQDLSFWGEITWTCTCGSASASGGSGSGSCVIHTPPSASGPVAWTYGYVAQTYNPSATTLANKFQPFAFTGTCYNLNEVYNVVGAGKNSTGTGVYVDDSGFRYDQETSLEKIVPIGPTLARIYPMLNPSKNVCNFDEFYFGPLTNQFAIQNTNQSGCCPSSSSSQSSSNSKSSGSQSNSGSQSTSTGSTTGGGGPYVTNVTLSNCQMTVTFSNGTSTTSTVPCCCGSTSTTTGSNSTSTGSNSTGSTVSVSGSNLSGSTILASGSTGSQSSSSAVGTCYWIWDVVLSCPSGASGSDGTWSSITPQPAQCLTSPPTGFTSGVPLTNGAWTYTESYPDIGGNLNCVFLYMAIGGTCSTGADGADCGATPAGPTGVPTDTTGCVCSPSSSSSSNGGSGLP